MREYILFLKNPEHSFYEASLNGRQIFKSIILIVLPILLLVSLLYPLVGFIDDDFLKIYAKKASGSSFGSISSRFLNTLIVAPILEELAFRLSLKGNKIFLSISLSVQTLYIFRTLLFPGEYWTLSIVASLIVMILTYQYFAEFLIESIRTHYNYYFYYCLLLFCAVHINNYQYFETYHLLFIPLFVLPQFFMGAYFSYIRLRAGLLYAILIHFTLNFISVLPLIFTLIF